MFVSLAMMCAPTIYIYPNMHERSGQHIYEWELPGCCTAIVRAAHKQLGASSASVGHL